MALPIYAYAIVLQNNNIILNYGEPKIHKYAIQYFKMDNKNSIENLLWAIHHKKPVNGIEEYFPTKKIRRH